MRVGTGRVETDSVDMNTRVLTLCLGDDSVPVVDHGGYGPPVLLVPPLGQDGSAWADMASAVRGFRRLHIVDLSRWGLRHVGPPEEDHRVDVVACVIRSLGLDRPAVVGIGGSAHDVVRMACRYPRLLGDVVPVGDVACPRAELVALIRGADAHWPTMTLAG